MADIQSIDSRLSHVEERLHRLESEHGAWREMEVRLQALEQQARDARQAEPLATERATEKRVK